MLLRQGYFVILIYMLGLERPYYRIHWHNLKLQLCCSLCVLMVWLQNHAILSVANRVVCKDYLDFATKHVVDDPYHLSARISCLSRLMC